MNDAELGNFYQNPESHAELGLLVNQYLIIETDEKDADGKYKLLDPLKWNGKMFEQVKFQIFSSHHFGDIKPKNRDPFQMAYMDSLTSNQLTFCTGPAGSGKTQIALAYAFQEFEKGKFTKIVIFTNPYIATGAVKLGFLPGTRVDKLLDSSIGSILISKLGERMIVEEMIAREELILMPMGDCRGYEVPEDAFVYFSEAQNTSAYLMKLFLQRTNDNCKICVEGDTRQVDSETFDKNNNGLNRAIEVFKGDEDAGHVQLQNIYRGRIARKAELICD